MIDKVALQAQVSGLPGLLQLTVVLLLLLLSAFHTAALLQQGP